MNAGIKVQIKRQEVDKLKERIREVESDSKKNEKEVKLMEQNLN